MRTSEFKYNVNDVLKDDKRDITIIDNKRIRVKNKLNKVYKIKCNKCGFKSQEHYSNGEFREEYTITESHLNRGDGCPCCKGNHVVVEGINDIPTTDSWMVKYFQGGYDEAKKYTSCSHVKTQLKCPTCSWINKDITIKNLYYQRFICIKCSDNISFPEKFMISILEDLKVNYIYQLSANKYEWCSKYKYDFYLLDYNTIIEIHGRQHYYDCSWSKCDDIKLNDKVKFKLALKNNIKNYIVIDSRKSNFEYIKQSIIDSKMNDIFDLSSVNWKKCYEKSISSLVKDVCEIKLSNEKITSNQIADMLSISVCTVIKYLKIGTKLGWCKYNAKIESRKSATIASNCRKKTIEVYSNGNYLGTYESAKYIMKNSIKLFNTKLYDRYIREAIKNNKLYKDYMFKYV